MMLYKVVQQADGVEELLDATSPSSFARRLLMRGHENAAPSRLHWVVVANKMRIML